MKCSGCDRRAKTREYPVKDGGDIPSEAAEAGDEYRDDLYASKERVCRRRKNRRQMKPRASRG